MRSTLYETRRFPNTGNLVAHVVNLSSLFTCIEPSVKGCRVQCSGTDYSYGVKRTVWQHTVKYKFSIVSLLLS